jgi:hypothetical protein
MLWTKIINLLTAPSCNEHQFDLSAMNNSIVKMYENPQILTWEDVETYYEMEPCEHDAIWTLTSMKDADYENPLYDILEEEEEDELTDDDIEYAEHVTDYDY